MKKPLPKFDSDEKLEAFLDTVDPDACDLTAGALARDGWFGRYERVRQGSANPPAAAGPSAGRGTGSSEEGIPAQRLISAYTERGLRRRSPNRT